ncbi:hypothetical protein [Paracoccus sp. S1E-3]|uniref:hypothetical protein n=1 Tax=Paracoccus sp. S1E-3 TaxID=2756130 RepID=UPI0015EF8497|nr:hypothetical protein [Paracoccus sp. S1E-3]MBA4489264.1 hypothetical protein [Paracoccus sp. S1E-3]
MRSRADSGAAVAGGGNGQSGIARAPGVTPDRALSARTKRATPGPEKPAMGVR